MAKLRFRASVLNGYICLKETKEEIDLGFFKKVKPLEINLNRCEYADATLTARMKYRRTVTNITDIKESVDNECKQIANNNNIRLINGIKK